MKRIAFLIGTILLMLAGVGCSSSAPLGKALLPEGIQDAKLPKVQMGGYVFASSSPPLRLPSAYFRPSDGTGLISTSTPTHFRVNSVTIAIGSSPDEFGGVVEFASGEDAKAAWGLFEAKIERQPGWGRLDAQRLSLVMGAGEWVDAARVALDSAQLASIRQHDPLGWSLMTNLSEHPPVRPPAAGVLRLEGGLLDSLGERAGFSLGATGESFGFLRVDTLAFGVYADRPVELPKRIDPEFLKQSGAGVLLVSKSSYPGFLVSFMLSRLASRTGMEVIDLGETNARYRMVEGLHLIIKNKGSLVFAALAATRANAEKLILSAISD